jgi:hypothetical protein
MKSAIGKVPSLNSNSSVDHKRVGAPRKLNTMTTPSVLISLAGYTEIA